MTGAPNWSPSEIAALKRLYRTAPLETIFKALPTRSSLAIIRKASEFGLRRSVAARRASHSTAYGAARLNRTESLHKFAPPVRISPDLAAARDRHYEVLARRDLTATVFGDPPPGYSALDRQRSAATTSPTLPAYRDAQDGVAGATSGRPRSARYPQV